MNAKRHTGAIVFFTVLLLVALNRDEPNYAFNTGSLTHIIDSVSLYQHDLYAPSTVKAFYQSRNNEIAWAYTSFASRDSLLTSIRNSYRIGLIPSEYHLREIDSLLKHNPVNGSHIDILLTDAFVKLGRHVGHGRIDQKSLKRIPHLVGTDTSLIVLLNASLRQGSIAEAIRSLEPQKKLYTGLKRALQERLLSYHTAMLSWEEQELLIRDVLKLSINLERCRWEPPQPERYFQVNIPSFTSVLVERDSALITSVVIVGKAETPTPTLAGLIDCITIYPYWHVPRSIATKELLPKIQSDTAYLAKNRFEVFDRRGVLLDPSVIDWTLYTQNNFPFVLRQMDGTDNALGVIKFHFDNPYGVYLHDTNAKILFQNKNRALSHGCIRLQQAHELANYFLNYERLKVRPGELNDLISSHTRMDIPVRTPLPILVRYFTADGNAMYEDVYSLDPPLLSTYGDLVKFLRSESPRLSATNRHMAIRK